MCAASREASLSCPSCLVLTQSANFLFCLKTFVRPRLATSTLRAATRSVSSLLPPPPPSGSVSGVCRSVRPFWIGLSGAGALEPRAQGPEAGGGGERERGEGHRRSQAQARRGWVRESRETECAAPPSTRAHTGWCAPRAMRARPDCSLAPPSRSFGARTHVLASLRTTRHRAPIESPRRRRRSFALSAPFDP